jgi:glucosylglycerol-phosphate synthase
VGFHIARYASNFVSVASSLFDVDFLKWTKVSPDLVSEITALTERNFPSILQHEGREVRICAAGVGVNVPYIEERASAPETEARAAAIRRELGEDVKLVLSVGRTDYTKGGVEQLESFGRVLERNPDLRGKLRLMHVSVAANRGMVAYEEVQNEIEQTAGRINGAYGTLDWQPITLVSRAIAFDDLVAYYRAADVAWITPLADGMNLVCKEFCAARVDGDGVLVLSEFAGAAVELHAAITVNPFSHNAMDSTILQAVAMEEEERRDRMASLRTAVARYDIVAWGDAQQRQIDAVQDHVPSGVPAPVA